MKAIYKRELKSLFGSLTAYVFIAIYLVIFGRYFKLYILDRGYSTIGYPVFASYWVYVLFALLTMKSLPEERKEKIDQLLYTSPVSVTRIVVGKFLAMCTVWLVTFGIICTGPLIIDYVGSATLKTDYAMLFAYFVMGCAFIAISMFISSLTESQLIAAIVSLVVVFTIGIAQRFSVRLTTSAYVSLIIFIALAAIFGIIAASLTRSTYFGFLTGFILALVCVIVYVVKSSLFEGLFQKVLAKIALPYYLEPIVSNYMFDIGTLILYVSVIVLFLFFTVQSIQKRRYS